MRIIRGSLKGRVLKGYDILGTRPTMDRVKESIMGSIQDFIPGSVILDLFAGTGNLGIEAISMGCCYCYFVDYNKSCAQLIRKYLKEFLIEDRGMVIESDYRKALKKFFDDQICFDVVFIDPPYDYDVIGDILKDMVSYSILKENSILVLEYQNKFEIDLEKFQVLKEKRYGDKMVTILKYFKK